MMVASYAWSSRCRQASAASPSIRGAGGISQRSQARGLEQHPVRDRRLSRELLDLPAKVEKLGA